MPNASDELPPKPMAYAHKDTGFHAGDLRNLRVLLVVFFDKEPDGMLNPSVTSSLQIQENPSDLIFVSQE